MEVKTIAYKRVNNLGNYSSEHLEMVAELELYDDVDQCAKDLKNRVETALGLIKSEPLVATEAPEPKQNNYDKKPW